MKLQKALAVIGAGVLLFAATDAITYAATGSSLVLGKINQANAMTTIQNTGTAPALRLLTNSTATSPLVVNGKGKVTNLYADRAATADNAGKVGGRTVAQVRAGINAATVAGKTPAQIVSDSTSHYSWGLVDSASLIAGSAGVSVSHLAVGQWCVTVAGLDLGIWGTAGVTVTSVYDFDPTSIGNTPATTSEVELAHGNVVGCTTGFRVYTFALQEADGSSNYHDAGFMFQVMH